MYPYSESASAEQLANHNEHPGIHLLQDELQAQSHKPPGNEPAIGAFCAAVLERSHPGGDMRPVLNDMLVHRAPDSEFRPSKIVEDLRSIVFTHKDSLHPLYDYSLATETNDWNSILDKLLETYNDTADTDLGGITSSRLRKMIQHYQAEDMDQIHYSSVALVGALMKSFMPSKFIMANIGKGTGLSSHLASNDISPFKFTELLGETQNNPITNNANRLISALPLLDGITYVHNGNVVDENGRYFSDWLRWVNGSRSIGERNDHELMIFYRQLLSQRRGNDVHVNTDVKDPKQRREFIKNNKNSYNLICMDSYDNLDYEEFAQLLTSNGLILVHTSDMQKAQKTYRLDGYTASNGQCLNNIITSRDPARMAARLHSAKLAVNGKLWTPEELIAHVSAET